MPKSETIWVKAGKHGPCPLPVPVQGRQFVGEEPMEIPNDRYARRRLEVGDLIEAKPQAPARASKDKE